MTTLNFQTKVQLVLTKSQNLNNWINSYMACSRHLFEITSSEKETTKQFFDDYEGKYVINIFYKD